MSIWLLLLLLELIIALELSAFLISNVLAKDLTGHRKKRRNSDYYSRLLLKYEENMNLRLLKWPQKNHALNPYYVTKKCKRWYNKNKGLKNYKSRKYFTVSYDLIPAHKIIVITICSKKLFPKCSF
uniref:Uncharacterized protein n=1 Tax=Amphimedon queenslandica TaxID=400682 RepID=A0A1X7SUD7_AMPQE